MKNYPLVSVIIPVFNAEKYITEALSSVFNQTYKNLEIICVNDASKDKSLEILQSFGRKIILIDSEQNCGIGGARNKALVVASGEYISFLDADDIWKPEKLEAQVAYLEKNTEIDVCFSDMQCFISPELSDEVKNLRYCNTDASPGLIAGTMLARTASFKKVGLFDQKWKVGEFVDWFSRAEHAGIKSHIIPEVYLSRRIHATNTGVTARTERGDYIKIVKQALLRKRQKQQ